MKKVRILAFVSAVATALLLFAFLNKQNRHVETAKASVLVAASDIPVNTAITVGMIKTVDLPPEAVILDAITDKSEIIGKVTECKIFAGEQLISAKFTTAGESNSKTLAYAVEPGMRAISVPVDETSGVAYMITPGNRVDIIGEFMKTTAVSSDGSGKSDKASYTTMLLEDISVLAVDNVISENGKASSDKPAYTTLTLQVTPKQAMELSEAQYEGQLKVILRSPVDKEKTNQESLTLNDVISK